VWAKVEEKGLEPHIPLKGGGEVRDERRKKAKQVFSSALYRLRAVGEGLFGGTENKASLWFPSGDLASYGPEAGLLGGGGLQPPGVPYPRLVRQALINLTEHNSGIKI